MFPAYMCCCSTEDVCCLTLNLFITLKVLAVELSHLGLILNRLQRIPSALCSNSSKTYIQSHEILPTTFGVTPLLSFLCYKYEIQDVCHCFPAVCAMDVAHPPVYLLQHVPSCWPTCSVPLATL